MTIEEFKAKHGHVGALATAEEIIRAKVLADRRQRGEDYCLGCAEGPFPISEMRLITYEEDPHTQFDDGTPVRICKTCVESNEQFEDLTRI